MNKKDGLKIPASSLLIILGLILIIFRNAAPELILRIFAGGMIVVGAAGIIQQILDKQAPKTSRFGKGVVSAIYIIIGIVIISRTGFFAEFFKYVFGGAMILLGLKDMIPAITGNKGMLAIILGVLAIILGVLLFFLPAGALTLSSGLSLIYCGIASIYGESRQPEGTA